MHKLETRRLCVDKGGILFGRVDSARGGLAAPLMLALVSRPSIRTLGGRGDFAPPGPVWAVPNAWANCYVMWLHSTFPTC